MIQVVMNPYLFYWAGVSVLCVQVSIPDAQRWSSLSIENASLEEVSYGVVSHVDGGVR